MATVACEEDGGGSARREAVTAACKDEGERHRVMVEACESCSGGAAEGGGMRGRGGGVTSDRGGPRYAAADGGER